MRTIWKFPLEIADEQFVNVPRGATALDVQVQNGVPCIWAIIDEAEPVTARRVLIRGTGHDCSGLEDVAHLGTFQLHDGAIVFHVFDGGEVT